MKRFSIINIDSPVKKKKIEVTVSVALAVIIFFVWLGVGMYLSVPENSRSSLVPMSLMYLVFPVLVALLSAHRVYTIVNSNEPDEENVAEKDSDSGKE